MPTVLEVDGLSILDAYGVSRSPLAGNHTASSLAKLMVDSWISYMECHHCGRADYCKFAISLAPGSYKKKEIRCGVVVTALSNFIERTFSVALSLNRAQLQHYLDAAFYYAAFVLESEQSIGASLNSDILNWFGKLVPVHFGHAVRIRDTLNKLGECLRHLPDFNTRRSVLMVEGEAEKAFLEKLRESHSSWFLERLVESYGGRGNRKPKRIAMLLEQYNKLGYGICFQGDADGKGGEQFAPFIAAGQLLKENTFAFRHDFESAVPLPLLGLALAMIGVKFSSPWEKVEARLRRRRSVSVSAALREIEEVDLRPMKVELAKAVAELLNRPRFVWWQDRRFMASELGRFLHFVRRAPS